jgi:hypothetical protein
MASSLLNLFFCSPREKKPADVSAEELSKSIADFKNQPVYKTLSTEIIAKIKDSELEQAIFDNISINMEGDSRDAREIVKSLTLGQQAIFITGIIEGEVNNGGFNQFYFNSSGQFADMGEEAFRTIGANKFADLVKQANSTYNEIKDKLDKYDDGTIESFSKSYSNNPLNDLDERFYKLYNEEPLTEIKIKYIRDNVKQFVTEYLPREGKVADAHVSLGLTIGYRFQW